MTKHNIIKWYARLVLVSSSFTKTKNMNMTNKMQYQQFCRMDHLHNSLSSTWQTGIRHACFTAHFKWWSLSYTLSAFRLLWPLSNLHQAPLCQIYELTSGNTKYQRSCEDGRSGFSVNISSGKCDAFHGSVGLLCSTLTAYALPTLRRLFKVRAFAAPAADPNETHSCSMQIWHLALWLLRAFQAF